ncbi:MAG: flagellar basal body-associated FliL family protein [Pseudomonadota bacterium]
MAEQEATDEETGGSKKNLILMIVVVLVAVGASIGGTIFFLGQGEETAASPEPEVVKPKIAIYHQMRPSFIVNFVTDTKPRYLQAELSLMARDPDLIESLIDHTPLVRSRILKVLSDASFDNIRTHAGKEALRARLRDSLNELLESETGQGGLESVLFTNFVLQ